MAKKQTDEKYKLTREDKRVKLYPDGKYRWVHEVNLWNNPTVIIDVWKVLMISMAIVGVFVNGIFILAGDYDWETFLNMLGLGMLMLIIITVLTLLGYLLYALLAKGKYVVLFIMDEKEVVHKQMPESVKVAKLIGNLNMLAGSGTGKIGMVGTGMLAKTRTSMNTTLSDVKLLKAQRWMNVIQVNETLNKNRVYVNSEDFDFVFNFLAEHCTKAKVKL